MDPIKRDEYKAIRVVKLGGSLLDVPNLRERVLVWLAREPAMQSLIVVGGGEFVEALRRYAEVHRLGTVWCHTACLDLMNHSAAMLAAIFPEWPLLVDERSLEATLQPADPQCTVHIVTPNAYRRQIDTLPQDWSVTSDSMAACLAQQLGAHELVLLKSALPQGADGGLALVEQLAEWSQQGLVDSFFTTAAGQLSRIRLVNLRTAGSSAIFGKCDRTEY